MDQATHNKIVSFIFTRHFDKPKPARMLEEVSAVIVAIAREADGLLTVVARP